VPKSFCVVASSCVEPPPDIQSSEDAEVGGMDGAGAGAECPRGVVLAMDIAGAASRAATRVRKTQSLL
jgi:hypothetical protein